MKEVVHCNKTEAKLAQQQPNKIEGTFGGGKVWR
jgi:hypothetical protein